MSSTAFVFFFLMIRRPPRSTLLPYPTLSRSRPPRPCRTSASSTTSGRRPSRGEVRAQERHLEDDQGEGQQPGDRKRTRLNSSHANISYAVFCLKKKKILENH